MNALCFADFAHELMEKDDLKVLFNTESIQPILVSCVFQFNHLNLKKRQTWQIIWKFK